MSELSGSMIAAVCVTCLPRRCMGKGVVIVIGGLHVSIDCVCRYAMVYVQNERGEDGDKGENHPPCPVLVSCSVLCNRVCVVESVCVRL